MKYKGIELVEYKPTESIVFNPPKKMLVWDSNNAECSENDVVAFIPSRENFPVIAVKHAWEHCAEIPKQKSVTNRELARWLAEGKGEMRSGNLTMTFTNLAYDFSMANDPIDERVIVRKWDDTGWFSPTREYLGLEEM